MSRPSEPLLTWLRDLIQKRGLNVAAVAERAKLPRQRVRKLLAGAEPMLVDELMQLSEALEIAPSDMGLGDPGADTTAEGIPQPPEPVERSPVDPFGNHPEQLFKVAFGLGVDFFFICEAEALADSGVPGHILAGYAGRDFPIKLDAAYHSYNEPRYGTDSIRLTLSFDQLYECTFPYTAVKQFILFPATPEVPLEPDPPSEEEEEAPRGFPHLRLVT